jgi:hypothetical protein
MQHEKERHQERRDKINVAHLGIVADYEEVLPALIAKFKELKSK